MKKFVLIILGLLTLTASTVYSQQWEDENIRHVWFDTLRATDIRATPIAVEQMKYIGTQFITSEDSLLMQYVTTVCQRDLDFYAEFELVLLDSFYLQLYEIKEIDLLAWRTLGATYVVRLEAELPGYNLRVHWTLFDAVRKTQIDRGRIEKDRRFWREIAHDVSNEIVHTLTGDKGIFRSKIVYVKEFNKAKEIFISDYDGANERQLTYDKSINLSPSISPDNNYVYYTSYVDGDPQLYRVDIKTEKSDRLGKFPGIAVAPAVSPDGNKIACVLSKDGNSEIYVLDTNGRVIKRLTNNPAIDSAPTWSPDGRMIAFSSDRSGRPQIYIMDSDGLNQRRLTFRGGYNDSPIWSLRGNRITFVSRTKSGRFDLASIDTAGVDYRILTELGMNENPHFAPDGKHIVFSSNRLGPREIFTMDITGRNQRRVTRTGGSSNPDWGPIP